MSFTKASKPNGGGYYKLFLILSLVFSLFTFSCNSTALTGIDIKYLDGKEISNSSISLELNSQTITIKATPLPENATLGEIDWIVKSDNEGESSDAFEITAKDGQTATIKAKTPASKARIRAVLKSDSAKYKDITISVNEVLPTSLSIVDQEGNEIAQNKITLSAGESKTFKPKFTPDNTTNKKVAWSISENSLFTKKDNDDGSVTLTAPYCLGKETTLSVTSNAKSDIKSQITASTDKESLKVDFSTNQSIPDIQTATSSTIALSIIPREGKTISSFESSDTGVVSINNNSISITNENDLNKGKLIAITVKYSDDSADTFNLIIDEEVVPHSMKVLEVDNNNSISVEIGESREFSVKYYDENNQEITPTFPDFTLNLKDGDKQVISSYDNTKIAVRLETKGGDISRYTAVNKKYNDIKSDEFIITVVNPKYLIFYSPESFSLKSQDGSKYWMGTVDYSTDKTNWTANWEGGEITSVKAGDTYYIYVRGSEFCATSSASSTKYWALTSSNATDGKIYCSGDARTLLNYSDAENAIITEKCFAYLLCKNPSLVSAPSLPATVISEGCYAFMFSACTSLASAPASLPATNLGVDCYFNMFNGCTSLASAPASLPAMTLADGCYENMFKGCEKLVSPPSLPATTLAENCYAYMFQDCKALISVPSLPATTLADGCYYGMFYGCSKLKFSEVQEGEYQNAFTIGSGDATDALGSMFTSTTGTFAGNPTPGATYYTSNTVVSAQ